MLPTTRAGFEGAVAHAVLAVVLDREARGDFAHHAPTDHPRPTAQSALDAVVARASQQNRRSAYVPIRTTE